MQCETLCVRRQERMKSLRKDRGGSQEEDLGFEKRGESGSETVKEGESALGRLGAGETERADCRGRVWGR